MDWLNQLPKVNNKFKFQLFGRNIQNLNNCYANIEKYDPNNTRSMSPHAFNLFLNSFGVFLTTQEIRIIKQVFSQGDNILYLDFIQNVRNDISPKRKAVIDHAFLELANGRDAIPINQLLQIYDINNHPYVRTMLKSPQKVFEDFERAILSRSADRNNLNEVEFIEYLLDVNACVPLERQEFFIDIVLNGFRINDNRVTIDRLKQMEVLIYEKVRQRTYIKKDEGLKAQNAFRFFDMEDKGFVDFERFKKALQKLGCGFSEKQTRALFEKHANENLLISYEKICALFFEMGSGVQDNKNPIFELSKKEGYVTSPGMTRRLG